MSRISLRDEAIDHNSAATIRPEPMPLSQPRTRRQWRQVLTSIRSLFIPVHTYAPLRAELHLSLLRLRGFNVKRKFKKLDDALVNIGPGPYGKSGWVNIDAWPEAGVNCVYDCRKSLPFPDSSVKGIFCEHLFEHLDFGEEAPKFLSECHRVLKPSGVIRLIVPDAEKYMRAYCLGGWDELTRIRPLNDQRGDYFQTYNTRMELINMVFRQLWQHKYAYDFETLELVLHKNGFLRVVREQFGQSQMPDLCLDQPRRADESLYVEATR